MFYLLTPHMMERVLHMDALANGDSYLRFGRDGRVHIAVATGRNLFEVGADANAEALREKFRSEIRSVTQLLDAAKWQGDLAHPADLLNARAVFFVLCAGCLLTLLLYHANMLPKEKEAVL